MINGKKILAIIPARGGSKGIPQKNIKPFFGKPLIAWTIEEASKSKYIDKLVLSSDDKEIISIAVKYGCEVPFVRPDELAKDETPGVEPIIHALQTIKEQFDYVCVLQPTSPLRNVQDIDTCIESLIKNNATSIVSVCEVEKSPYWIYFINNDFSIRPLLPDKHVLQRQESEQYYQLNGAIYIAKTESLLSTRKLIGKEAIAFKMPRDRSIDIDNEYDFKIAEFLISKEA